MSASMPDIGPNGDARRFVTRDECDTVCGRMLREVSESHEAAREAAETSAQALHIVSDVVVPGIDELTRAVSAAGERIDAFERDHAAADRARLERENADLRAAAASREKTDRRASSKRAAVIGAVAAPTLAALADLLVRLLGH